MNDQASTPEMASTIGAKFIFTMCTYPNPPVLSGSCSRQRFREQMAREEVPAGGTFQQIAADIVNRTEVVLHISDDLLKNWWAPGDLNPRLSAVSKQRSTAKLRVYSNCFGP